MSTFCNWETENDGGWKREHLFRILSNIRQHEFSLEMRAYRSVSALLKRSCLTSLALALYPSLKPYVINVFARSFFTLESSSDRGFAVKQVYRLRYPTWCVYLAISRQPVKACLSGHYQYFSSGMWRKMMLRRWKNGCMVCSSGIRVVYFVLVVAVWFRPERLL